jgi:predicted RNA-binding protein with PIN domain
VARAGLTSDPIVPPPPALGRYLGFTKLGPRALGDIARIVGGDAEFRARVAAAVAGDDVGEAGWLWLTRPDGWQDALDEIVVRSEARDADEQAAKEERSATRRLAAAQAAAQRAEAAVAAGREALDGARAALAEERARREAAESRAGELADAVADLTAARAEAVRQLKAAEARLVERSTEVKALKARLRELAPAPAQAESPREQPAPPVPAAEEVRRPAAPVAEVTPPATDGQGAAAIDVAGVVAEVGRAARGAAALADGLAALADLIAARGSAAVPTGTTPPTGAVAGATGSGPTSAGASAVAGRRTPLELPGGVFDDTAEAAAYLLRTPGSVLIVDGYNVSMTAWPELAVADQRRRLVAALYDLALRTTTPTEVVFDGAEVEAIAAPSTGRRLVRARFSEPGVEADDVIIAMVERLPAATPVIVASSDNRVRAGARRGGANLLYARQLAELFSA